MSWAAAFKHLGLKCCWKSVRHRKNWALCISSEQSSDLDPDPTPPPPLFLFLLLCLPPPSFSLLQLFNQGNSVSLPLANCKWTLLISDLALTFSPFLSLIIFPVPLIVWNWLPWEQRRSERNKWKQFYDGGLIDGQIMQSFCVPFCGLFFVCLFVLIRVVCLNALYVFIM